MLIIFIGKHFLLRLKSARDFFEGKNKRLIQ